MTTATYTPEITTTAEVLVSDRTIYCGAHLDRMTLPEAHHAGVLRFVVCQDWYRLPNGYPDVIGFYGTIEEAIVAQRNNPLYVIKATYRGQWCHDGFAL